MTGCEPVLFVASFE